MHTQKNRLPCRNQSGYIPAAPHKTGAGFRSLLTNTAHNRASGFFVRTVSPRLFRTRIMVGRTGPTSVGPVSSFAGGCNPVRLATQNCNLWMVSIQNSQTKRPNTMANRKQQRATLRVVTSRLKSTADFPAHSASRISCTSICCMSAATHCQTCIPPLYSATWRMTCVSCRTSLTSTDKQPEAILRPFAGGFRTSVVGGF